MACNPQDGVPSLCQIRGFFGLASWLEFLVCEGFQASETLGSNSESYHLRGRFGFFV